MSEKDMRVERLSSVSETDLMAGKIVLITGGTGGIGKATAIGLARVGARVGITGRDLRRCEQAAAEIRTICGNTAVVAFGDDLYCRAGCHRMATAVLDAFR